MAKANLKLRPKFEMVPVGDFVESPINPNRMSNSQFKQLVQNLKRDGALTSAVFSVKLPTGKMMVVSGHHRVAAARRAGIKEVPTLWLPQDSISNSRRIALQISHNAINGQSDPDILLELASEIQMEDITYSGVRFELDGDEWKGPEAPESDPVFDFRHVILCVRPETLDRLEGFLEKYADLMSRDKSYLIRDEDWERLKILLSKCREKGWKTPGRAFGEMLDAMEKTIDGT